MHNSGQLPLPEVFGLCNTIVGPKLFTYYCDVACKLKAHLKHVDPEALGIVRIALGAVHKVTFPCFEFKLSLSN